MILSKAFVFSLLSKLAIEFDATKNCPLVFSYVLRILALNFSRSGYLLDLPFNTLFSTVYALSRSAGRMILSNTTINSFGVVTLLISPSLTTPLDDVKVTTLPG